MGYDLEDGAIQAVNRDANVRIGVGNSYGPITKFGTSKQNG